MADISTITASNGTTYNIKDSTARGLLPSSPIRVYTSVTGTASKTSSPYYCARYDVTDESITEYTNGMMVSIRVPVAGNGSYGTALQINSLGYKPIVYNVNSMISTRYGVGSQITAVYNSTQTATLYLNSSSSTTVTGCWQVNDYDSNDVNYAAKTYYGTPKLSSASAFSLYRYQIVLPLMDGSYVPYSNGNNQATTYTKTINTTNAFNPFEIIYYYSYSSTAVVSAGGKITDGYLYYQFSNPCDIRYAMNINSSGTAGTTALTAQKPTYIKAKYNYNTRSAVLVPDSSSSNYLERSSIVQDLPSSNPDTALSADETYIYIYIGHAHDKYRVGWVYQKTVYNWDAVNNCIQVFDGNRPEAVVFVSQSSTFSEIYNIKQKGKIPIYKDSDGYAFPEQVEDSSPSAFTFTKATDAGVIKWYKVDTADAWTNGTKDTIELYWCTYGSTTYNQITQALAAGKLPVLIDSFNIYYVYARNDANLHQFKTFRTNVIMRTCRVNASNGWTTLDTTMQTTGNLVTSISSSSADDKYPSAKCVYNAINGETLYASNQSVSNGNNVTVTAPAYLAGATYFADIKGYIYSTERTTRVYLKPTSSNMDCFYGEILDVDSGNFKNMAVTLTKVSSTSYTYRMAEQSGASIQAARNASWSAGSHTLVNFGRIG